MMLVQYIFGFMSLGWQVYKYVKEQEASKDKRRAKCKEFRSALRQVKAKKDTKELEDLFYDLGIVGNDYGRKLPDAEKPTGDGA